MKALKYIFLGGLFVFMAFAILHPNPFGNNPDIIADESYFLTSSLSAIEKMTLPGWEFSQSGNYYGGTQTYIDYVVLIPVLGAVTAFHGFSVSATKLWVALNTGELLHILRIVNGLLALGTVVASYLYFSKRNIPRRLATTLSLFLFLLLSNVLIIQFLHTAKVWVVYILITSVISALFIANEYYLSNLKESFIQKETYVAILVWSSVLVFFQNYVGAISIFLVILYAILLEHIKIADILAYLRKYWYLGVLFALSQISFIYRAIFLNWLTGSFAQITATDAAGATDWHIRIFNPIIFAVQSHPLAAFLFVVSAVGIIFLALRDGALLDRRKKTYLLIALAHPFLVYLIFHIGIGFSFTVRYAIFLTLAFAFSATISLSMTKPILEKIAAACGAILFFVIGVQAISLYWYPSSEVALLKQIEENYNSPKNIFIEKPDALHLTLPMNTDSLSLLNKKRQEMGRYQFLLQNKDLLSNNVSFKPLTLLTYTEEELTDALSRFKKSTSTVWTITTECKNLCTAGELQAGTCFGVHVDACGLNSSHEINVLPTFLSAKQLGNPYIVRTVN